MPTLGKTERIGRYSRLATATHAAMNDKQLNETRLVHKLFAALGVDPVPPLDAGDRPDVIAHVAKRRIGIEVTQLSADEISGVRGSRLRTEHAVATKRQHGVEPGAWGNAPNADGAVRARVAEKVNDAEKYDRGTYDSLWLLIAAAIPLPGAVVASMIFLPPDLGDINSATHDVLCASRYERAYLHVILRRWLFAWSREYGWRRCDEHCSTHG